ncbi:hypothetical protein QFZ58_004687 [Streptomyces sp. B1I3]|nr:hypothetical protein [Streptomyces sp. B1I3]
MAARAVPAGTGTAACAPDGVVATAKVTAAPAEEPGWRAVSPAPEAPAARSGGTDSPEPDRV